MGFMDKVKTQASALAEKAQEQAKVGQEKLSNLQTKKQSDALLLELGGITYLSQSGRAPEGSDARAAELVSQLQAHESAHGPITVTAAVAPAGDTGAYVPGGGTMAGGSGGAAPTGGIPAGGGIPSTGGIPQSGGIPSSGGIPQAGGIPESGGIPEASASAPEPSAPASVPSGETGIPQSSGGIPSATSLTEEG